MSYKNPLSATDITEAANALLETYSYDAEYLPALTDNNASNGDQASQTDLQTYMGDDQSNNGQQQGANSSNYHYETVYSSNKNLFFEAYKLLGSREEQLMKRGINLALEIQKVSLV
jgi:hypothetical protein